MVELKSVVTCPNCGTQSEEIMPEDSFVYMYECSACKQISKPKKGDCCVFCSFGTVPCPPVQKDLNDC